MTQELVADGKTYISSKRASEMSGYAQDYIGQLARKQLIDARRIGGLWYVFLDSLTGYQKKASEYKPQPPSVRADANSAPDTVISFDGRDYLSASRAAAITGYHQDYVGQLARSGAILSRQVGNRWYVDRESILSHKSSKDALLAAVQSDSVGFSRARHDAAAPLPEEEAEMTYFSDSADLMPVTTPREASGASVFSSLAVPVAEATPRQSDPVSEEQTDPGYTVVPIRKVTRVADMSDKATPVRGRHKRANTGSSRRLYFATGALATIVIVLSLGFGTLKGGATYTVVHRASNAAMALQAAKPLEAIASFLEEHVIPPLTYVRK